MFTIRYRDFYILGYFDRDEVRVTDGLGCQFVARTMHAAKCRVTRLMNARKREG